MSSARQAAFYAIVGYLIFIAAVAFGFALAAFFSSCGPAYPACTRDRDCELGEFCVRERCQLCRSDDDCPFTDRCVQGDCKEGAR